jgi:hypothetical protein
MGQVLRSSLPLTSPIGITKAYRIPSKFSRALCVRIKSARKEETRIKRAARRGERRAEKREAEKKTAEKEEKRLMCKHCRAIIVGPKRSDDWCKKASSPSAEHPSPTSLIANNSAARISPSAFMNPPRYLSADDYKISMTNYPFDPPCPFHTALVAFVRPMTPRPKIPGTPLEISCPRRRAEKFEGSSAGRREEGRAVDASPPPRSRGEKRVTHAREKSRGSQPLRSDAPDFPAKVARGRRAAQRKRVRKEGARGFFSARSCSEIERYTER